jgi:hypothetical protein
VGANQLYRLLLNAFITSSEPDEMAVKAIALLAEFFRTLDKELQKATDEDDPKALAIKREAKYIYERVKEDLKTAHGDVLQHLADIYGIPCWSEVQDNLVRNEPKSRFILEVIRLFLKQTQLHKAAMTGSWDDLRLGLEGHGQS